MGSETEALFKQRLGRYQAAIALENVDRIPLSLSIISYVVKNANVNDQIKIYELQLWTDVLIEFLKQYPELDTVQASFQWAPMWDVVNSKMWRVPGRDISSFSMQQYVEKEWMKEDEYRKFIDDPIGYHMEVYFPRIFGEFNEKGSIRSYMALLKSGIAQGMLGAINREAYHRIIRDVGMPLPTMGMFSAPFDYLSDFYRGLNGIMRDMYRRPDMVLEACEVILKYQIKTAMATADPKRQLPIFIATHKPCFLSPKQFDTFYWPTFKKGVMTLIEAGWKFRVFLEGDWSPHWHHLAEFPKGTVLCDIDNEGDIFRAKQDFGFQQCITGGIPTDMLILGTPEDVRARVKLLCETVGKDGGWMPHGAGHIPKDTKPENFRALIDAVLEYGRYSEGPSPEPKEVPPGSLNKEFLEPDVITPWEVIKRENSWSIPGDEEIIKLWWERLETIAFGWIINFK